MIHIYLSVSSVLDDSRSLLGAIERLKEVSSENVFASASELPAFFLLASLSLSKPRLANFLGSHSPLSTTVLHPANLLLPFWQLFWRSSFAATSTPFHGTAFRTFGRVDALPCHDPFVVIDFKSSCSFAIAQLFFLHGFHYQFLKF